MRTPVVITGIVAVLALGAGQAVAQDEYHKPNCEMNSGFFLVRQSIVYLKGATEEQSPDKRAELLVSARLNLLEAIERGQAENPSVWYFLGRTLAMAGDALGADSAFARAEQMLPDCADDIRYYRQVFWVKRINLGVDSLRAGSFEGAKQAFREANTVFPKDITGFYYLARIFGNEGDLDSAIYYFKTVVEAGTPDTTHQQNYEESIRSLADLYSMDMQWDSAAAWHGKYRELYPNDSRALIGQAEAYSRTGDESRAVMMYDSVLAMAAEMGASDLFKAGEALFVASQFDKATQEFELGLEKNPYSRAGLANLANTFLSIASDFDLPKAEQDAAAKSLETTARRLIEIGPYNQESHRLLAAALQLQQNSAGADRAMAQLRDLRFEILVDAEQVMSGGFAIQGRITNLQEAETTVPEITFEFLDAEGSVVTTEVIPSFGLAGKEVSSFALNPQGEAIVGYRYKAAE